MRSGRIEKIEVGLPKGDTLPIFLHYSYTSEREMVGMQMIARSNWSRCWYPVSQIRTWPGEVLLTINEEEAVKQSEADFFSVLAYDAQNKQYRLLAYRVNEQPMVKVYAFAERMQSAKFQQDYFKPRTFAEEIRHREPRLDRDQPLDHRPKFEMVTIPFTEQKTRVLPRTGRRLYEHDWVHRIVNLDNPVPYYRHTLKQ